MKNSALIRLLSALWVSSFALAAVAQNTTTTVAPDANAPTEPAVQTNPHARWEKEIAAFEAADKKQFPAKGGVLFIGSSSIRMWRTLAADFPNHHVLNRGFGGSQIADSVHFAERIVFPYEPKMIVFFAGGNDIAAKKEAEQVFADFKAFVEKVHAKLPDTKIAYISIPGAPVRCNQVEKIKRANALVEALTREKPNLAFINIFPLMLDENGKPREELYLKDRLHMNADGYAIWKKAVEPFLPQEK
jgi:lysophospholipase L1-like esterase